MDDEDADSSNTLLAFLEGKHKNFRNYLRISGFSEIARCYFIMNAFDGAVTTLGILVGSYIAGVISPRIILSTGIGAGIAMAVSGFFGAFLAEEAERTRRIKNLERALNVDLDDTIIEKAARFASVTAALVDAFSPLIASVVALIPLILSMLNIVDVWMGFLMSIGTILVMLLFLGIFLGSVSGERHVYYAVATTSAGVITGILGIMLQWVLS